MRFRAAGSFTVLSTSGGGAALAGSPRAWRMAAMSREWAARLWGWAVVLSYSTFVMASIWAVVRMTCLRRVVLPHARSPRKMGPDHVHPL